MRSAIAILLIGLATTGLSKYLPPAQSKSGMVVSSDATATKVGVDILQQGGNAIDAAVAVGYALAVTHPCCGNIGGGGFMTLHLANGKNVFIDFREKAPASLTPEDFIDSNGKVERNKVLLSYLGTAVPGTVMGLNTALKRFGTMPLSQVMLPAIQLAQHGHMVSAQEAALYDKAAQKLAEHDNVKAIFFKHGSPIKANQVLKQPQLAKTLQLISQKGTGAFYRGPIAEEIVKASDKHGGKLTLKDFSNYTVTVSKPLLCNYHGNQVITAPPPGSGVTVCEILKIVEPYPLNQLGFHAAIGTHYTLEAMRYAFRDRNSGLGDPAFVNNPTKQLLSDTHIKWIQSNIKQDKATPSSELPAKNDLAHEKMQTTHYTVIDKYNNVASTTVTLNGFFGTKMMAGDTGFFLNNEIDDFAIDTKTPNQFGLIQGKENLVAGNKRPLSSMSPTIVLDKSKTPILALGAAGGSTIITSVVQTIENNLDYGMDINTAVNMPRYHMQWLPDQVFMEPFSFSKDSQQLLHSMGYNLETGIMGIQMTWGQVAAISQQNGILYGANDNRYPDGLALGS